MVLLVLALAGGLLRLFAPNPSPLRDFGSLMLVLWVPVIGNVIAFAVRKIPFGRSSPFAAGKPFLPQLLVEITPLAPPPRMAGTLAADGCALVVGTEGFWVRFDRPLAGWLDAGAPLTTQAQFRRPDMALSHFAPETPFRIVAQERLVGQGRVLELLGRAPAAEP